MIKRANEMKCLEVKNLKGGDGTVLLRHILDKEQMDGKANMCAVVTLKKGCGLGVHSHNPDAEIYYVLDGRLTVTDNGETKYLEAGDVMYTAHGDSHSARNDEEKDLKMLAIVLA